MRVAFLSWRDLANANAGGSEVVVDHLIEGLRARGHEAELLCGGPVAPRNYPVTEIGGTFSQYLRAPFATRRRAPFDLLVDVANGMSYFAPLWWRGPTLLLVHHVQGEMWHHYYFPEPVAKAGELLEGRVAPVVYRDTEVLAVSDSTRRSLVDLGFRSERIHLMHSGIDRAHFGEPSPRAPEPQFLALGRLAPHKSFDRLLDIWAEVQPVTGGRLVIAGDGPEREALEARDVPATEFVGFVSEERKRELLGESWLLVHRARQEGWGLVVMEAAAHGTPSLALDGPGMRDSIVDGLTGERVADDAEFAERWVALATDHPHRERLGAQARSRAREYTWDQTVDAFLKAADVAIGAAPSHPRGVRRSARLFTLFRQEQTDPERFYTFLAEDTIEQLRRHTDLQGRHAVDIGGGAGYMAQALRAAGASCTMLEYEHAEMFLHGRTPEGAAIRGDAQRLPLRTGSLDIVHSSNVLEHVPDWRAMLTEMVRVLRPATGIGYVAFPNWLSPWGGHETAPWHYLGGDRAAERYEARYGHPPKNRVDETLYRVHLGQVRRWFRSNPDVVVEWMGPRYYPEIARPIVAVPGLREFLTWNLMVVFRRNP